MGIKYVEVVADEGSAATVQAIAEQADALDCRLGLVDQEGKQQLRLLIVEEKLQWVLDTLQNSLGAQTDARILVLAVEAALPRHESSASEEKAKTIASREALYQNVERNSRLDSNYVVLAVLSTVVVAIGLIANNVAVVIGSMVIAPLLGPSLALSFATALGDAPLLRSSALTLLIGISIIILLSILLGWLWPHELLSKEILSRTEVGLESIALALASGAAAALSLTTGLSSVLVGVMVAVALLPPSAVLGLMLGSGNFDLATGAFLLLGVNVVSINLASNIVFFLKGINPRTWREQQKARRATLIVACAWLLMLCTLVVLILLRLG